MVTAPQMNLLHNYKTCDWFILSTDTSAKCHCFGKEVIVLFFLFFLKCFALEVLSARSHYRWEKKFHLFLQSNEHLELYTV